MALNYESQGIKKKHGTQFTQLKNGIQYIHPYEESINDINMNRAKLDLSPLSEHTKILEEVYGTTILIE